MGAEGISKGLSQDSTEAEKDALCGEGLWREEKPLLKGGDTRWRSMTGSRGSLPYDQEG